MYGKYFVYVMEGRKVSKNSWGSRILYVGMTGNIKKRTLEHFHGIKSGYMKRNRIEPWKLVYFETVDSYWDAVKRERILKEMPRHKKVKIIEEFQRKLRGANFKLGEQNFDDVQKYFWGGVL